MQSLKSTVVKLNIHNFTALEIKDEKFPIHVMKTPWTMMTIFKNGKIFDLSLICKETSHFAIAMLKEFNKDEVLAIIDGEIDTIQSSVKCFARRIIIIEGQDYVSDVSVLCA